MNKDKRLEKLAIIICGTNHQSSNGVDNVITPCEWCIKSAKAIKAHLESESHT